MREFRERKGVVNIIDGYGHHWLMFFYRHPMFDGLRGIEWYNRKRGRRDEPALQRMAQGWESLGPRLIQHVDFNEQGVIVEDLFTQERFHMPYCETLPEPYPWGGTFCLLEERDGGYYMNGVAAFVGPGKLKEAENLLKSHMGKTGDSYEKTAIDLFPEITGALLQTVHNGDAEMRKLVHTTLVYSMENVNEVMTAIYKTGRLEMDEWDGHSGKGSLVANRYRYDDNLANGSVYLNEIDGFIEIKADQLTFQTMDQEAATKFKQLIMDIPQATFIKEEKESQKVPARIQASTFSVVLEEGVPPVFAHFSHQAVLNRDLSLPLPQFNGKAPAEMATLEKQDELELWLRELEYSSYQDTKNKTKEKWTADFNQIRIVLNRPLSPFTTLQEKRESALILLESGVESVDSWTQEELELWDEMGIPVHLINVEYARDLLAFFKEKGEGKSSNTFYKYRLGVQVISYFLDEEGIEFTTEILPNQREALIAYYYLNFNSDVTINQAKGFFTAAKSFATWLDQKHGTTHGPIVKQLIKELETPILQAITILEAYTPYQERRYEFSHHLVEFRRIMEHGEVPASLVKGYFRVKSVTTSYVNLVKVDEPGEVNKTNVPKEILSLLEPGMIIFGALTKKNNWKIYSVERVYPKQAGRVVEGKGLTLSQL